MNAFLVLSTHGKLRELNMQEHKLGVVIKYQEQDRFCSFIRTIFAIRKMFSVLQERKFIHVNAKASISLQRKE